MQLTCPYCYGKYPLEAATNDVAARNTIKAAFDLTPIGHELLAYVRLFSPPKRAIATWRMLKLLDELLPMVLASRIEHGGRIWPAPHEYWRHALIEMLDKRDQLTLPLKSHNYLLTMIAGLANKSEGKGENKSEDRRAGRTQIGGQVAQETRREPQQRQAMPDTVRQQLEKFKAHVLPTEGENHG